MNENNKQKIQDHIQTLPENVQNAILGFDWLAVAQVIAKQFELNVSQTDSFITETMFVVIGVTDATEYEGNLVTQVGVTPEQAREIENIAEHKIFSILQKMAFGSPAETDKDVIDSAERDVFRGVGINLQDDNTQNYEEVALDNILVENKPQGAGYQNRPDPYLEPID